MHFPFPKLWASHFTFRRRQASQALRQKLLVSCDFHEHGGTDLSVSRTLRPRRDQLGPDLAARGTEDSSIESSEDMRGDVQGGIFLRSAVGCVVRAKA